MVWNKMAQVVMVAAVMVLFGQQSLAQTTKTDTLSAATVSTVPATLQGMWTGVFDSDGQGGRFSTGVKLTVDETTARFELDTGATWKTPLELNGEVVLLYFGHTVVQFLLKKGERLIAVYDGEWNGAPRKNSIVLKKEKTRS